MSVRIIQLLIRAIISCGIVLVIVAPFYIFYNRQDENKLLEERYHNALNYVDRLCYTIDAIYYNKTGNEKFTNMTKLELYQILIDISNNKNKKKKLCDLIERYDYENQGLFDDIDNTIINNRKQIEILYDSIKGIACD